MAVHDAHRLGAVGYHIDRPGQRHRGVVLPRHIAGERHHVPGDVLLRGINALGAHLEAGDKPQLGGVAADDRKLHLLKQAGDRLVAHARGAGPHRIEDDRDVLSVGHLAGMAHGGDGAVIQGADVEVDGTCQAGDVIHVVQVVAHDGRGPDGEKPVGHVVDGDVVGDAVHERALLPHCRCQLGNALGDFFHGVLPCSQMAVLAVTRWCRYEQAPL